jgi:DNA-binding transcriptional MerR regulator
MSKGFRQITFEFGAPVENEIPQKETLDTAEVEISIVEEDPPAESEIISLSTAAVIPAKKKSTRGRRSLKDMALASDLIEIPEDDVLFQKQYYSIGEVATMFREKQSLIRYWETEFDILKPRKNRKGDRHFRPVDIKNLVMIYDLLRRRKFTIEGAKDYLKKEKKADEKFEMIQSLRKIRDFMLELKASL